MTFHRVRISRRAFLRVAALAVGASLLGNGRHSPHHVGLTASRLRAIASRSAGAVAMGSAYLELRPELASTERLVERLTGHVKPNHRAALASDDRLLRQHVRQTIEADFAAARVVTLHGWVVSHTEAQLAALVLVP